MSDQFENDGPYQDAVSAEEIERRIMDSTFPKTSMEWWAHREIKELRDRLSELETALNGWQQWWGLPWQDRRPDIAERCYRAASAALNGEKT